MQMNWISKQKNIQDFNYEKIWGAIRQILATNITWELYSKRGQYHLVLLENKTSVLFITGDQPVINTFAFTSENVNEIKDLEFYYPLSPYIAILITNRSKYLNVKFVTLTDIEVATYNNFIIKSSFEQIYSLSKEDLENVLKHATASNCE